MDADNRQLRALVTEDDHEDRLDRFLTDAVEDMASGTVLSRERVKQLIQTGQVCVNGQTQAKASFRVKEGDEVVCQIPECQPIPLEPEVIPLDVWYEDAELLVVNKPAGMLTHPTGRERTGTLVNALLAHCDGQLSGINGFIRPGIVHRLDRDTTGLLVVAKTDRAHQHLSQQLKDRTMHRTYQAIVQGVFPQASGTITTQIGRHPKHRDKMAVLPDGGRLAITHWQVLEPIHQQFSHMQLVLDTGRTHQIRVHMAYVRHPILGDPLYGSGVDKAIGLKLGRQLLQAFSLSLIHPVTDAPVEVSIPTDPLIESTLTELRSRWESVRS